MYDVNQIAEALGISKVTVYNKLKLEEVKPFITPKNNKQFVSEEGLKAIKESLKYNVGSTEPEVEQETTATLQQDLIQSLKDQIQHLKGQIATKDRHLENMQVLLKNEQEKNEALLALPQTITAVLKQQKEEKKGFWNRLLGK